MLSLKHSDNELINECGSLIGLDFSLYLKQNKPYLSLDQLKIIEKKGFTIGAHSVDHPEFRYLSTEKQIEQIIQSIGYIKNDLNQKYTTFSFPFTDYGLGKEVFESIYNMTDPKIDITFGVAGLRTDSQKMNLQRIPMEYRNYSSTKILLYQYFKFMAYSIIGKQKIER